MAVLGQRVLHHRGEGHQLRISRDDLLAHGIIGIVWVDQRDEIRRDIHPEKVSGRKRFTLALG